MTNWDPAGGPVRTESPGTPGDPAPTIVSPDHPLALRIAGATGGAAPIAPWLLVAAGVLGLASALWIEGAIGGLVGWAWLAKAAPVVGIVAAAVAVGARSSERADAARVPTAVAIGALSTTAMMLLFAWSSWGARGLSAFAAAALCVAGSAGSLLLLSRDDRHAEVAPAYVPLAAAAAAAVAVPSMLTFARVGFDVLTTSYGLEYSVIGVTRGVLLFALLVPVMLVRSRPALAAVGAAASVLLLVTFGDDFRIEFGVWLWITRLGLAALAGLAAWQFVVLQHAPGRRAPDAFAEAAQSAAAQAAMPAAPTGDAPAAAAAGASSPAVTDPSSLAYAGFGARLGSLLIDGIVFLLVDVVFWAMMLVGVAQESVPLILFGFAAALAVGIALMIVYCRMVARTGQSWGRRAAGIRLVRVSDLHPPTAWAVFGRDLSRALSAWACYLGYLWMLWDPRRQTWHDKIVGTVVVKAGSVPVLGVAPAPAAATPLVAATAPVAPLAPPPVATPAEMDDSTVHRPVARPASIRLDDDRVVPLSRTVVIGRDPVHRDGETDVERVALEDHTRSVSKTHLALGRDGERVWAEDRHSTNGVVVVRGAVETALPVGVRTPVLRGDLIRFGDRWLTVES